MLTEPMYCSVRGGWCRCQPRCDDDKPREPRWTFSCVCDHCDKTGELYEWFPTCRECCDTVCQSCGTDYEPENNRITCKRCGGTPEQIEKAMQPKEEKK